ncbi:MAG: hypothetical protein AAGC79_09120 [Pseudomonadota bacterium]
MAKHFDESEWAKIDTLLAESSTEAARATAKAENKLAAFGLPERRADSLLMATWNIRKFGKADGHTEKAREFYAHFACRCDLIAIQEIMDDMFSLRDLRDRMQELVPSADYRILCSDVTGKGLDGYGLGERLAFIFDQNRIRHTEIASDISFDRRDVVQNVNNALDELRNSVRAETGPGTFLDQAVDFFNWATGWTGFNPTKMNHFFDYIRAPHFATFEVMGRGNTYEVAIANAHLHYGKPKQREKEFLALLEWIFQRAKRGTDAPITMILGDLNLDFKANNEQRRNAIEAFLAKINKSGKQKVQVNFPFLYDHPIQGLINTNARETQTFDQIAYFHRDPRLPKAEHNKLAGTSTEDFFDYGMFNFVELFKTAGVIGKDDKGKPDYSEFEFDVSDHMPIWVRMPVPVKDQWTFDQLETD